MRLVIRGTLIAGLKSSLEEVIQKPMNRTVHLVLQGAIQGVQVFLAFPGVDLTPTVEAALHSFLAAMTLVVAGVAQGYNTDGSPQAAPFRGKGEDGG